MQKLDERSREIERLYAKTGGLGRTAREAKGQAGRTCIGLEKAKELEVTKKELEFVLD